MPQPIFRQLLDADSSTFTYLVGDPQTRQAILIDAVKEQIERDLRVVHELELQLKYVLDTHVHADHVTAAGAIAERTSALSVAGRLGAGCADVHVGDGDCLQFGCLTLRVRATPGHTDDSLTYVLDDRLFTGDALLIRGCGRTDFQNGDSAQLYRSITTVLFAFSDDTLVYPAHDYKGMTVSTIGEEKRHNPRVSGKSASEFIELMSDLDLGVPKKIMEAVPANRACGLVGGATHTRSDAPQAAFPK